MSAGKHKRLSAVRPQDFVDHARGPGRWSKRARVCKSLASHDGDQHRGPHAVVGAHQAEGAMAMLDVEPGKEALAERFESSYPRTDRGNLPGTVISGEGDLTHPGI